MTAPRGHGLGIDWGTTHRRFYLLDPQGQCIFSFDDDQGALASQGRFPQALDAALQRLPVQPDWVLMSGMVGSAMGWQEVPYLSERTVLTDLPGHVVPVSPGDGGRAARWIAPGYCVRDAHGQPDVMRGEETQLLGACALGLHNGWFVLPGTHSKWVQLRQGRVVQLRTYMTGELFALLSAHGTLAQASGADAPWDADAFAQGLRSAGSSATDSLSHLLFGVRAKVVCKDMPAASARAYLSGLLIGAELHDVRRQAADGPGEGVAHVIASPGLAERYLEAAAVLQMPLRVLDYQQAYIAALQHFQTYGMRA